MSESKTTRKRNKNFDQTEKDLLLDIAISNKEIIESKLTNQITNEKKAKVWRDTQAKINSLGFANRSISEIKTKWSNMVQKAKKDKTEVATYIRKTGGGPPPPALSPSSQRIIEIFGESAAFCGLTGVQSSFTDDEEKVTIVGKDSSSPRSFQLISEAMMSACLAASGQDEQEECPLEISPGSSSKTTLNDSRAYSPVPNRIQSAAQSTSKRTGTITPVSASTSVDPQVPEAEIPSTSVRKLYNSGKKRKTTVDDVTQAQYDVLQLQKEKIRVQIRYYEFMNKKMMK